MPRPLPSRAYQADPTGSQAMHGVRVVTGRPAVTPMPPAPAGTRSSG